MFAGAKRLLGVIDVVQSKQTIKVQGIPADVMLRDISRIWSTSKIGNNMFTHVGRSYLEFPNFFALDVLYAIETILEDRTRYVSKRVLNNLKEKLLTETWLADTVSVKDDRLNLNKIKELKYPPLTHQQAFIDIYNTHLNKYNLNGYLFAGSAGSGKTIGSLYVASCLESNLIIIVSPKNALERVWETTIQSAYKEKQNYWLANGATPVGSKDRFIIGNYEALDRMISAMLTRKAQLGKAAKITIILDESHNLNDSNSLRTQKFFDLCRLSGSSDILWLSGTPIKAVGSESIGLFRCIDPMFNSDVEARFRKIYGKDANKGLDILQNRIGLVKFTVEKKELNLLDPVIHSIKVKIPEGNDYTLKSVGLDMEKFVDQQRALYKASKNSDNALFYGYLENFEKTLKSKTEIEQFKYYKDCLKSVIYEHDFGNLREVKEECLFCNKYEKESILPTLNGKDKESFRHVKTLIKYVSLKIQGECLGRVLGKKRIECHVKMVPHIDFVSLCESTTKKTVIFTSFVEALKETENVLKDAGLTPLLVYGETNKDLSTIVKKFEIDEDVNPLVATYNSLSTAVPLIMADNMITINAPFRNYILEQAISRVHRIGADTQVNVWMVSLDTGKEPNMSTRSSDILAWSQQQVEKILGISAPFEVTEGFESFGAGQSFQVTMEDYGIVQTVNIPKMESTNFLSSW